MSENTVHRELRESFRTRLMPWSKNNEIRLVLARYPSAVRKGGQVGPEAGPGLHFARPAADRWPAHDLCVTRSPELCFITEGVADIGVMEAPQDTTSAEGESEVAALSLPAKHALILPPGTSYSVLSNSPRNRGANEQDVRVLWLRVQTMGCMLHLSVMKKGERHLKSSPVVFLKNSDVVAQTQILLTSAESDDDASWEIVRSCLRTLILLINENLSRGRLLSFHESQSLASTEGAHGRALNESDGKAAALERALTFVRSQITVPLSLEQIANYASVSVPQLKKLFRSELNMTIMQYVARLRLEQAKSLLIETNVGMQDIAEMSGYKYGSHFTRLFTRETGVTPTEFRRRKGKVS